MRRLPAKVVSYIIFVPTLFVSTAILSIVLFYPFSRAMEFLFERFGKDQVQSVETPGTFYVVVVNPEDKCEGRVVVKYQLKEYLRDHPAASFLLPDCLKVPRRAQVRFETLEEGRQYVKLKVNHIDAPLVSWYEATEKGFLPRYSFYYPMGFPYLHVLILSLVLSAVVAELTAHRCYKRLTRALPESR